MDPLTALGLAANVLQFVAFASKLFTAANEIHHAGASTATLDISLLVSDLSQLNVKLKSAIPDIDAQSVSEDDQVLRQNHSTPMLTLAGSHRARDRMSCYW